MPGRRIIPARAGFTATRTLRPWAHRDHPRSRGVYRPTSWDAGCRPGSSPLARGLPTNPKGDTMYERIIPARAGFTPRGRPPRRGPGDHPRSRGVYPCQRSGRGSRGGSSPLARGLPRAIRAAARTLRIIPARAGFTVQRELPIELIRGSSPLARGLRSVLPRVRHEPGIIPARAGFTCDWPCWPATGPDHPRSRGVYHR